MNSKAIIYGVTSYIILFIVTVVLIFISSRLMELGTAITMVKIISWVLGMGTLLISGYLAGRVAKKKEIIHGIIVGILGATIVSVIGYILSNYSPYDMAISYTAMAVGWIIFSIIICGFAGALGYVHNRFQQR